MKERNFCWQGINNDGARVQGIMQAVNKKDLAQKLERQNIVATKIYQNKGKKIATKHITDFSRQLATMINADVPLLSALNIIAPGYEHAGMKNLIAAVIVDIKAGLSLSAALKKHRQYFDGLFCNLVAAGEQSGTLAQMLNHVADYKEKIATLKRKIRKAMFYPIIVLLMATIVTAVMLIFVVPQFTELFNGFGAALPIYTQFIIKLSNIIKCNWHYILLFILSIAIIFKLLKQHSIKFQFFIGKYILKLPLFGELLKRAIMARFARTLSITFKAGLPLKEALKTIAQAVNNNIYQQAILAIQQEIVAGHTIAIAMEKNPLFHKRIVQMIHIGEESGSLDVMLTKIAEYYEAEVNHVIDNLSNLLEPMIMAVLGVIIGGLIIGMYLPIFKLGTVI
jgi:type IV pilus assembly protein PilC